jgi:LysR family glycine cleavage system transcriptional activator
MPLRLPPLNSLRLFEAAARQKSFKRAAEELHLTPSAVSHAVQTLEEWLGTELFHRGARGLTLTPVGADYADAVGRALILVATATEQLPGRRATGTLSISSAPTFANRWLLPRLARFTAQFPEIQVSLDTSHRQVEFPLDGIDLAIRLSADSRSNATWIHLVRESLVPVCSPALRSRLAGRGDSIFADAPLIHVTAISEDWPQWFRSAGLAPPDREGGLRVDTLHTAWEAAAQGLGIALGRRPLVDHDLEQERLVEAAGPVVRSSLSYWLVGADRTFERPEIRAFRTWLMGELTPEAPAGTGVRRYLEAAPPRRRTSR